MNRWRSRFFSGGPVLRRGGNLEFPADKFQAPVRVNKGRRSLEDITVKLHDSFRVAGVVKITEAGLHARFQTLDPAHPPQPVALKAGGAGRILLVKIARDFETTRADFKRVAPYDDQTGATTNRTLIQAFGFAALVAH